MYLCKNVSTICAFLLSLIQTPAIPINPNSLIYPRPFSGHDIYVQIELFGWTISELAFCFGAKQPPKNIKQARPNIIKERIWTSQQVLYGFELNNRRKKL